MPGLEVTRADDVTSPGTINTDIVTRLMHADLVVADITYPNPNVFYELGLRHAARAGTILIKEENGKAPPFDIHPLRHLAYQDTAAGLATLSDKIKKQIEWFAVNPAKADNLFLELAHLTKYSYPKTAEVDPAAATKQVEIMLRLMTNPKLAVVLKEAEKTGGQLSMDQLSVMVKEDPDLIKEFLGLLMQSTGKSLFNPK